jgi:hypothetical protein
MRMIRLRFRWFASYLRDEYRRRKCGVRVRFIWTVLMIANAMSSWAMRRVITVKTIPPSEAEWTIPER